MEGIQSVADIGLEKIDQVLICVCVCVEGEMTNKHHLSGDSGATEKNNAARGDKVALFWREVINPFLIS